MTRRQRLLRRVAFGGALGILGLALFAIIDNDQGGYEAFQDLDSRTYVSKSRLHHMRTSFDDHFRPDANRMTRDTTFEVPWRDIEDLFNSYSQLYRRCGLMLRYGLKDGAFKLGVNVVGLTETDRVDSFSYREAEAPFYNWRQGGLEAADRGEWIDDYQDSRLFAGGRYFREFEVRRHANSTGYDKVVRGVDPKAEIFAWQDELVEMYRQTIPYLNLGDSVPFLVARCVAEPEEELQQPGRFYQHRICLSLRLRRNGGFRDLLDDLDHKDSADVALPFRMKGADFGNLCPPSCDYYVLPLKLKKQAQPIRIPS